MYVYVGYVCILYTRCSIDCNNIDSGVLRDTIIVQYSAIQMSVMQLLTVNHQWRLFVGMAKCHPQWVYAWQSVITQK